MSPGLDPSLFDEADRYRRAADAPQPPPLNADALRRQAAGEARVLFKQAAHVLQTAGVPTILFYHAGLLSIADTGEGWDLGLLLLTSAGTAHRRPGGYEDATRGQYERRAASRKYKRSGRPYMPLGAPLEVASPRSLGDRSGLLAATDEGRVEIHFDTYYDEWSLLETWLNGVLRDRLRP